MVRILLSKTEYILRETRSLFSRPAVLWSGGKDSSVLLHMISRAFHDFPFKVLHLDNGKEFDATYEYMDKMQRLLGFDIMKEDIAQRHDEITGLTCCGANKTDALKAAIKKHKFDAIVVGIRWDEHGIRGIERYFSPRDREFRWKVFEMGKALQDAEFVSWGIAVNDFGDADHVRVHPLLHWSELDVWQYIKNNHVPVNDLYFSKNGRRFRSIGCKECSLPVQSNASSIDEIVQELETTKDEERQGRVQDKEIAMERLRALGYM